MKYFLFAVSIFLSLGSVAQLQALKLVGKNSSDYSLGFGGFLKFSLPVSDASDLTFEGGANVFSDKNDPSYGWALVPVKLGYRYTLNQTGTGFYLEPQGGYNVYGIDDNDNKFTGFILAAQTGYLFEPTGRIQFDVGLLFETAFHDGGNVNYVALRITHNFSFRRRESDY